MVVKRFAQPFSQRPRTVLGNLPQHLTNYITYVSCFQPRAHPSLRSWLGIRHAPMPIFYSTGCNRDSLI